ncbi:MAG: cytochrome c oxidase assembly protein, partial [Chloroflexi bacterium]|nr:cytochrome c oxidase assembly protein [Chloroflexota bacterium]
PVNRWQRVSFFAGLFTLFLALQSPIEPLAEHMLSFHQVQHILMRMVGPLLVLMGAPLTPMLRGLPPWALHGVVKPVVTNRLAHSAYERLTNPVLTTVLFLVILYLWQVPPNMNLALRNDAVHELMHFTMLFSGFLFYWLVIDPKPHRSRLHYGLRVLYLGLIIIPNTLLGVAIVFAEGPLYAAYQEVGRPFNISLMDDQQLGGLLLWVPGDMMSILVAGVVMVMWYQKEEEETRAMEAKRAAALSKDR